MNLDRFGHCRLNRIEREKETLALMIRHYCRRYHGTPPLCADCTQLLSYAHARTQACRYGQKKPVCALCTTHCYKKEAQQAIRQIMRTMGPRMIWLHPFLALAHLWDRWWGRRSEKL